MKVLAVFVLVVVALAQAKQRDWSKIIFRDVKVSTAHAVPSNSSAKITGGNVAEPHSRPWQVGLFLPITGGTAFCGGSLIDDHTVLTAAHCVDGVIGEIEVILGAQYIEQDEPTQVIVNSTDFLFHEDYNAGLILNDVGLIRLPQPVTLNENIQPVALASGNNDFVGDEANVSGWGKDHDGSYTISAVLREVTVNVISNDECAEYYDYYVQAGNICTSSTGGRSTCNGDSGGPLVDNGVQIGIVSFGSARGCEIGYPAAFTRVTEYLDWIQANRG